MRLEDLFKVIDSDDKVVVKHFYSDDVNSLFASRIVFDDYADNYLDLLDKDLYDNKVIQINHSNNFILITITNTKEGDKQ